MKHILALTDFSSFSDYAVSTAFEFAKKHKAKLTILHGQEDSVEVVYDLNKSVRNGSHLSFDDKVMEWEKLANVNQLDAHYVQGSGNLVSTIKKIDLEDKVDLLLMGATGKGESESTWGSTTRQIVSTLEHPVLVIKESTEEWKIEEFVFASAFDPEDQKVLTTALDLIDNDEKAFVHLLCINTLSYFTQPTVLMKAVMKDFEKLVGSRKVKSHFYSDYSVDAGIRHYLEDHPADILVMKNDQGKSFKKLLMDSNTIKVIEKSKLPILSIPL